MITNLADFMKPVEENENSLKGVVTPYDQKFRRKEKDGFTLFEIIQNDALKERFAKNIFPEFQIMENSEIFMEPTKRIIQTMHEYYIKWFILDENFVPSHDHDYPYVNVPKKGYLVKIVIPRLSDNPIENECVIEYACDINNIEAYTCDSIHDINRQESINVDMKEDLQLEAFDCTKYPEIYKLVTNKQDFFKKYLSHIFD